MPLEIWNKIKVLRLKQRNPYSRTVVQVVTLYLHTVKSHEAGVTLGDCSVIIAHKPVHMQAHLNTRNL